MKGTMKKALALTLTGLMGATFFAGCNKGGNKESDQHLEVYVISTGYKTDGIRAVLETFGQQDWVKEKYPNYTFNIKDNRQDNYALNKVKNPKTNEFDMLFTSDKFVSTFEGNAKGESLLLDITESVYNTEVIDKPGVKYVDALADAYVNYVGYTTKSNSEPKYFEVPFITGTKGIVYSQEIFERFGYTDGKTPLTTDELFELCDAMKENPELAGNAEGYSFIEASQYYSGILPIWWAQYDGVEAYDNFWKGKYTDSRGKTKTSNEIFTLEGRLHSLQVIEDIVKYDNGYFALDQSNAGDFMQRQTTLLKGNYAMSVCADWYDTEMKTQVESMKAAGETPHTVRIMKTPVVSAIINKLTTVTDDAMLRKVIEAIDKGETSYEGVSEEDFAIVKEARSIYELGSMGHVGVIPSVSNSQDVAIDVFRFMATEVCQNAYMKATMGQNLPFDYDFKNMPDDVKEAISPLQQDRLSYYYSETVPVTVLPPTLRYPLAHYSSLQPFQSANNHYGKLFSPQGAELTAQKLFDDTIAYWTPDKFDMAIERAGLKEE